MTYHWTNELPNREGWWWRENKAGGVSCVKILPDMTGNRLVMRDAYGEYYELSELQKGYWSSEPIPLPKESPE